ncbi:MAG: polyprenyl synthetase family protein [Weeksellaceae bacterium]|nr:polyprenyl synthetase family protein [Weeksellaceae bacterium]
MGRFSIFTAAMTEKLQEYKTFLDAAVEEHVFQEEPIELFEPINYILALRGKRLRPIITLMACDLFSNDYHVALKPALAMEFFHNFTLMHDDIMDSATMRRGKSTVHRKFGVNAAILSGDALLIKSYQYFEDVPEHFFKPLVVLFSETGMLICKGQQMDMNFESRSDVTEEEYMEMIFYKTGALTAGAFKIGALLGNASAEDAEHMYEFGKNLGIAFQLKDDLLDVYGDKAAVGKKIAGDILENKKTILYIEAMKLANEQQKDELLFWYSKSTDNVDKIYAVTAIFDKLDVDKKISQKIEKYTILAKKSLENVSGNVKSKDLLYSFSDYLIGRTS